MDLYLLNTDTTHSERKPSEFSDAEGTRVYIQRPSGKVIAAQTFGEYTQAQAQAEIGTTHRLIADQSGRYFGKGKIVGLAATGFEVGDISRTKVKFYVYK